MFVGCEAVLRLIIITGLVRADPVKSCTKSVEYEQV